MRFINSLLTIGIVVLCTTPAYAVLGEQVKAQSVEAKSHFSISSVPGDRNKVKEFFDKSGNVFGTCYDPRVAKDLNPILGANYTDLFAKSIKESTPPRKREPHPRVQLIKNSNIAIRSTRIGRSLIVCVYDPQKLPEGVNENEIH